MTVVERTLPWQADGSSAPGAEADALVRLLREGSGRAQADLVRRAWRLAAELHEGQTRKSGEAYISHPFAVASIVGQQTADAVTIAAALLHDVVEDTAVTLDDLDGDFGAEVAAIVDGVTKLDRIHFDSREAQQAATMRKLFVAMANDLRVLIIKLADRLHNMRTLAAMSPEAQLRIARETLEVYAPLANRLGMADVRQQLEDLAFAALHPRRYAEIDQMVRSRTPEREAYVGEVVDEVAARFGRLGIEADVRGRPKHLWSIYEKMVLKGREFEEIFDLVGIRVIVDSVNDCYAAIGSIHAAWRPVQGRFKDFIAMPKFNNYQSLHTTVVGPRGKLLEVQIRTREMNLRAEYGVAAHWRYKAQPHDYEWLDRIVDLQGEFDDPTEFMANLKVDLEQDEIVVFTPKGKVVSLPAASTPVDFAYAIHTELGHACIGAKVDGRLVSLDATLRSGETVEIFASSAASAGPSREWLTTVASPKATGAIKQWFAQQDRGDVADRGREEVEKALRLAGLPLAEVLASDALAQTIESFNYADLDALHLAVGQGNVAARLVASRVRRLLASAGSVGGEVSLVSSAAKTSGTDRRRSPSGVHVEGMEDGVVRLARCCTPVPGDEIIGFVTRGGGVSVHRTDCANAAPAPGGQADRAVEVEWSNEQVGNYLVSIEVRALDRTKLLRDVATVLADYHVNILACQTMTGADRVSMMRFDFEVGDPSHLQSAVAAVQGIESVYDVRRVLPHKERATSAARGGAGQSNG
jgi:guanosine-3',5'-bis(diphosphate) 3'-pyrophosphohydrolase